MNKAEQGVLQRSKLAHLLIQYLLPVIFCLTTAITTAAATETAAAETVSNENKSRENHVFILYSKDNTLHSKIIQTLSDKLGEIRPDIVITILSPEEKITSIDNATDLIIGIGSAGMNNAEKNYPDSSKLFISTDPDKYRLNKNNRKNRAILYMAQSYCRQVQMIKLLNERWKVISLLKSQEKPVDSKRLQQCADKYGIKIYAVQTTAETNMSAAIKNALNHSDALLALPDKNVYNSKTVKNILLTSYRHRKPVIGFSQNFVSAGALASIHSSTEQIAQSASTIIEQYFKQGGQFHKSTHYPKQFDISINRQVFRALDLPLPEINKIKQKLQGQDSDLPGALR